MRLPVTKYGLPQVVLYPLLVCALGVLLFAAAWPRVWVLPLEALLLAVFFWMLSFFRDPGRNIQYDENVLYSPADGTITDISPVDGCALGIHGEPVRALRIGMFLSIFNVHINRAPCDARIEQVSYKKGKYKNAMSPDAGRINESNDIVMTRLCAPGERLLVRQISGMIARHIVCEAKAGGEYRQGEPFGMIKFGSRTELYLRDANDPGGSGGGGKYEVAVKPGDAVRAGLTPLVRYAPKDGTR